MDILDVGSAEFIVFALLAVIVLGPERLARIAREAGKFIRNLKAYFGSLSDELKSELNLLDELNEVKHEIKKGL